MYESFLSYLWQMQYFDKKNLKTVEGDRIEIFNPGTINTNAGPDFANARIKIGSMDWVGSVEIHTVSSEWNNHHHGDDPGVRQCNPASCLAAGQRDPKEG
ncbi:MAG: DUF2851 family protein [Bacteroidota bacterium]